MHFYHRDFVSIKRKKRGCSYQCLETGIFIPDPNFSIPDPGSKRFRIPGPKDSRSRIRIKEFKYFLTLKTVHNLSKKSIRLFIPDSGSGFFPLSPDPGSATLEVITYLALGELEAQKKRG
jgi:hypothetical protein